MHDTDGLTVKKLTIRVPIQTYFLLDDLARAGRRPIASVARDLLVDRAPKFAPPLVLQLSPEAQELLKVTRSLISNLSQIDAHAARLGEPLARLSGPAGLLFELGSLARSIGIKARGGQLDPEASTELLARLATPARALNESLALPLNLPLDETKTPTIETWKSVLNQLRAALKSDQK